VEERFFLIDTQADACIAMHVAPLLRALSGSEYQRIAVKVEPDRGRRGLPSARTVVRTAVLARSSMKLLYSSLDICCATVLLH
jgi:hypothetical protein